MFTACIGMYYIFLHVLVHTQSLYDMYSCLLPVVCVGMCRQNGVYCTKFIGHAVYWCVLKCIDLYCSLGDEG